MAKSSDVDPSVASDPMWTLVDDFLDRAQRGERPTIDAYCEKHPELAEEIRDLFPALVVMEDLQPVSGDLESDPESTQSIPDKIGDYRIIGELGRGSMGVMYPFHPLYGGEFPVLRPVCYGGTQFLDLLVDGHSLTIPEWITCTAHCARLTVGIDPV